MSEIVRIANLLNKTDGMRPYVDWVEVEKRLILMGLIAPPEVKVMVYEGS